MKYEFPEITNIQQVRDAIDWHASLNDGKTEFIEAQRDGFIVFNYLVNMPTTFPDTGLVVFDIEGVDSETGNAMIQSCEANFSEILRELRGLTFYPDGTVAARKFHKFFNLGERRETEFKKIDWDKNHVILEKLDGSMITPFLRNGEIEWHTKMGATDVASLVYSFVEKQDEEDGYNGYEEFCKLIIAIAKTPIFEFCSRKNRIVVDHPKDRLVLLAIRDNQTGEYEPHETLLRVGEALDVEVVRQYAGTIETMEKFIEEAREDKEIEGYVIRFEDGHMLKVKADIYLSLHKAVSHLQQEKDVWRIVLEDKADDLKAILMEDQRDRLDTFQKELNEACFDLGRKLMSEYNRADFALDEQNFEMFENGEHERKKMFALDFVKNNDALEPEIQNLMFALYDGKDAFEVVRNYLIKQTTTGSKIDRVRKLMNDVRWEVSEK